MGWKSRQERWNLGGLVQKALTPTLTELTAQISLLSEGRGCK